MKWNHFSLVLSYGGFTVADCFPIFNDWLNTWVAFVAKLSSAVTQFPRRLQLTMVVIVRHAVETFDFIPNFVWKKVLLLLKSLHLNLHLSSPELRVHSLQMFGRTLGNWAHRLGPHTVGIKNIIKERDKAKDNYKLLYLSPPSWTYGGYRLSVLYLCKVRMSKCLLCCDPLVCIHLQHLLQQVNG